MSDKYVAAIGGSAGALNPLIKFFDYTPNDQVTYVVVRHLSVEHKSALKQILDKYAKLEIIEVEDGMRVEDNKIYLLPEAKYMLLENDAFRLVERPAGPNRAIDVFMQSLGLEKGPHSIAVILSGGGYDGVKGIEVVKAGGMVIAQTPASCEHASMPAHAIQSGYVDHTVLPSEMPSVIRNHVKKIS